MKKSHSPEQPDRPEGLDPIVSFSDEPLILVDEDDNVLGHAAKADCHRGSGQLHRAFSLFIFNEDGHLLIHQRSAEKPLWPMYWTNSCCSHPRRNEALLQAAHRRLGEEVGLQADLQLLYKFQYQARFGTVGSENELCAVLAGRANSASVAVNAHEIADWRFIDPDALDIDMQRRSDAYTPWFKMEWPRIRRDHWAVIVDLLRA